LKTSSAPVAALVEGRLSRETAVITGPEEIPLGDAVRGVGRVIGKHPLFIRMPVAFHYVLGACLEKLMEIPMVSIAQVRILSEGIVDAWPPFSRLPDDLKPTTHFTDEQIRRGLPLPGAFGLSDLRCCEFS
jgi:NADH dehydrogenase